MFEVCFLVGLLLATLASLAPTEEEKSPEKEEAPRPCQGSRKIEKPRSGQNRGRRRSSRSGGRSVRSTQEYREGENVGA